MIQHLTKVVQELSLARSLETIMAIVRKAARTVTGADGATFVLKDKDQCFYADEDAIAPLWKGKRFPMTACVSGWAMMNRCPAIIPDIYTDERVPIEAYRATFIKSMAMVPIRTLAPLGAIGVYWQEAHTPTDQEIAILEAIANTTAVAIENVQIYDELEDRVQVRTLELQMVNQLLREEVLERQKAEIESKILSTTDELTGLNNRRGFLILAEQQLKNAKRIGVPVCLMFIDLDGLKSINDNLGHEMGDRLIMDAAIVLKTTFRQSDVLARLGGDEFAIFVSGCDAHTNIISRLNQSLQKFNQQEGRSYPVEMSMGIALYKKDIPNALDQMMAKADRLMYQDKKAKKAGKAIKEQLSQRTRFKFKSA